MDNINNHLERLQTATWQTSEHAWTSFENELARLIIRSRLASSLPALTPDEFQAAVEAWSQVTRKIPEVELENAYVWAMENREKGFPIGAPDLVRAYHEIGASRAASPRRDDYTAIAICRRCFGSSMEIYKENGYKVARRCNHAPLSESEMGEVEAR